ncbi:MAG: hypothetical protein IH860_03100 [Chloroflexi bacterium]|nr:hypothetical protein [Chloroflexota bacterium]
MSEQGLNPRETLVQAVVHQHTRLEEHRRVIVTILTLAGLLMVIGLTFAAAFKPPQQSLAQGTLFRLELVAIVYVFGAVMLVALSYYLTYRKFTPLWMCHPAHPQGMPLKDALEINIGVLRRSECFLLALGAYTFLNWNAVIVIAILATVKAD